MKELTQDELQWLMKYEPDTGDFYWSVPGCGRKLYSPVGSYAMSYKLITIYGKAYFAHRLAWLYMTGSWPKNQIDHINHNGFDNRFVNLRDVTQHENQKNREMNPSNSSGITGVHWDKKARKWRAAIYVDKKSTHIGCYDNLFDAAAARRSAENKYGYHRNHGKKTRQIWANAIYF